MFRFINNSKGFSLLEQMMGAAMGVFILGVISSQAIDVTKMNNDVQKKLMTSSMEMTLYTYTSNKDWIMRSLNLTSNNGLMACFANHGSGCKSYASEKYKNFDIAGHNTGKYMGMDGHCNNLSDQCPLEINQLYRVHCRSNRYCSGIAVKQHLILHEFHQGKHGGKKKDREVTSFFTARDFLNTSVNLNASCPNGVISGFDPLSGNAICRNGNPPINCQGFSVLGLGTSRCGTAGPTTGSNSCTFQFAVSETDVASFNGATVNWMAQGPDVVRFGYHCQPDRNITNINDKDLLYFNDTNTHQAQASILPTNYNEGSVTLNCQATAFDELGRTVASCGASYTLHQVMPPPPGPSGPGGPTGSGPGSGPGSSGRPVTPPTSTASTSASVSGSGMGFSTTIR